MSWFKLNKKETREYGRGNGYGIAQENYYDLKERGLSREDMISECLEIEREHFRQYSPFEFYAKEWNNSDDPDGYWDTYDAGVLQGIVKFFKGVK